MGEKPPRGKRRDRRAKRCDERADCLRGEMREAMGRAEQAGGSPSEPQTFPIIEDGIEFVPTNAEG